MIVFHEKCRRVLTHINGRIEAAADDRDRGASSGKLKRALEE
jgi:hypothetical protein